MIAVTEFDIDDLLIGAAQSPRRRMHKNLHLDVGEPCQRLMNALCIDSYIAPHCHEGTTNETLMALRGRLGVILFDAAGRVKAKHLLHIGSEGALQICEILPGEWHTLVALDDLAVLFEVKAGPFIPERAKVTAPWAPLEGSGSAAAYLIALQSLFENCAVLPVKDIK